MLQPAYFMQWSGIGQYMYVLLPGADSKEINSEPLLWVTELVPSLIFDSRMQLLQTLQPTKLNWTPLPDMGALVMGPLSQVPPAGIISCSSHTRAPTSAQDSPLQLDLDVQSRALTCAPSFPAGSAPDAL